ncbi:MAG TPA: BON domain-containing protein [Bryobacteraceae bacterium]|nr:BON domain-containing protein [Bryobacteraceae bacterium]
MQNSQKEHAEHLRDDVIRQIEWDPRITSKNIAVSVTGKIVMLNGYAPTFAEKYAAEKAAQSVYGVEAVTNDIEVQPENKRVDPDIARDVVHAMKISVMVPDEKIKAVVSHGFVTLNGSVEWNYQKEAAESCARDVAGVRGVINSIQVKPQITAHVVSGKIEDALRRNAELDARRIAVSAVDGKVFLSGSVRSWFERQEAERAAWAAPGVTDVVDNIAVVA